MKIKISMLILSLCLSAAPVWAAEAPMVPVCTPAGEAIITLNVPSFDAATIWDARFGTKDTMIRFAGGVQLESGNVLSAAMEQDITYKPVKTALVEIDNRAKTINDVRTASARAEQQSGMIVLADGSYVIASTVAADKTEQKMTRLARYSHDLAFKSEIILKDSVFDYEAESMSALPDGKGYMVVVHAINRRDNADEYAVLFKIGANGKVIWKRAYRPGVANQIYNVAAIDAKHLVASGRVRNEDGRMAGWLMMLNEDGTIVWQDTLPRGKTAMIRAAAIKTGAPDGDHVIAVGQVIPYGPNAGAAWVVETDAVGNVLWQRYLRTTAYNLDARAVTVEADGRISIMANAAVKTGDEDGSNHIRLITLSPRGDLMNDEAYMQGRRAEAAQLITGRSRERLVIATIDAKVAEEGDVQALITAGIAKKMKMGPDLPAKDDGKSVAAADILRRQGWVFAATPLPPYRDPCIVPSESAAP